MPDPAGIRHPRVGRIERDPREAPVDESERPWWRGIGTCGDWVFLSPARHTAGALGM